MKKSRVAGGESASMNDCFYTHPNYFFIKKCLHESRASFNDADGDHSNGSMVTMVLNVSE
jgi:hypothetical protein